MRILINGGMGRMGSLCAHEFQADGHHVVIVDTRAQTGAGDGMEIHDAFDTVSGPVDCVLDVSSPSGVRASIDHALTWNCALVVGTTGLDDEVIARLTDAASRVPVLRAPNLSLGVLVLRRLAVEAARMLGEDYDIEIVEAHHKNKADAPSGTARSLAEELSATTHGGIRFNREGRRVPGEIGIASVRGGGVVGEHSVMFLGALDSLVLTHRANDRSVLAKGAVFFTKRLLHKPAGLWSVDDLV